MRIWYQEDLIVKNCPAEVTISLQGIINSISSTDPLIVIRLVITPATIKTLYTHNPAMRHIEDPSDEDIHNKYHHKIVKFKQRISNMDYENVLALH